MTTLNIFFKKSLKIKKLYHQPNSLSLLKIPQNKETISSTPLSLCYLEILTINKETISSTQLSLFLKIPQNKETIS